VHVLVLVHVLARSGDVEHVDVHVHVHVDEHVYVQRPDQVWNSQNW
jgi:hypothetical protein